MVYFSKKQAASGSATIVGNNTFTGNNTFNNPVVVGNPTANNQATNKQYVDNAINGCAKLGSANTFTQINTFNAQTNFKSKLEFKKTNDNGIYIDNYDYGSENYTALKFFKGSTNALQIECNNTTNTATISAPNLTGRLHINNLATPVNSDNAANKQYVDGIVKYVEKVGGLSFTRQPLNQTQGQQVTKYYATINYSDIPIPNGKHIISCYSKTIPVSGAHLVITFFPVWSANQCLIEIYQYNDSTDIHTNLNAATYCFTYLNV